jgi:hypothetical protein
MLIARTETARASMQGNMIALQQQGVVSFDWMDSGNENECGDCEDNAAGSPYTAENLPDYPAHPECCCNIVPSSVMGQQAQDGPVGSDNGPTDPGTILNLVSGSMNTVSGSATEDAGMDPKDLSDDAIASNTPKENKELMDRAEEALKNPGRSVGDDIPIVDKITGTSDAGINAPVFFKEDNGQEWVAKTVSPYEGKYEWAGKAISDEIGLSTPDEMNIASLNTIEDVDPKLADKLVVESSENTDVLFTSKIPNAENFIDKMGFLRPGLKYGNYDDIKAIPSQIKEGMQKAWLKDVLIQNADGHLGNYMVQGDNDAFMELFNIDDSRSGPEYAGGGMARSEFGQELVTDAVRYGELPTDYNNTDAIEDWLTNYQELIDNIKGLDLKNLGIDPSIRDNIQKRQDDFDKIVLNDIQTRIVTANRIIGADE